MSLPILANSFFEKHRPSLDVFFKWQSAAIWTSQFMPIYEWADVLFVGCSQPPNQKVQSSQKVVYVFCEAEILNQIWEEYQSPTVLMAKPTATHSPEDIEDANEKTVVMTATPAAASSSVNEDIPEGLSPNSSVPSAAPQTASFDDLFVAADSAPAESAGSPAPPPSEEDSGGLGGLDLTAQPTAILTQELPTPAATVEPIEEVAEPKTMTNITATNLTSITSTSATPEQVFQAVFKDMGRNFKKTMILVKQGEQIVPWKWDDGFEKSNPSHKKSAMSLAVPSPFRIVYRSQKSYHGYLVPNDLNDKFFADWNNSVNPDHLTLAPVLIDDVVIGMILGIGEKSADTKTCLLQTEHLAEAVAKKIKIQPQIIKAA